MPCRTASLFLFISLAAGPGCTRCGPSNKQDAEREIKGAPPSSGAVLRLPLVSTSAITTLDPIQSVELLQYTVDDQLFESLVRLGRDGKILPGLAESWQRLDSGKTWRFVLRESYFHDAPCFANGRGRRVAARDVVFSLQRGLDPRAGSLGSWALSPHVLGAGEFAAGKRPDVPGLRAIDDRTVEIELTAPNEFFLARLTAPSTFVVAPEAVESYGTDFAIRPVGSGPFRLQQWKENQEIVLARHRRFPAGEGEGQPVERIHFIMFRSAAQVAAAFGRGEVQVRDVYGGDLARIAGVNPLEELRALLRPSQVVQTGDVCKLHLIAVTMGEDAAFGASPSVRRALSQLFPRERLEREVLRGTGRATDVILHPMLGVPQTALEEPQPAEVLKRGVLGKEIRIAYASSRVDDAVVNLLNDILEKAGARVLRFPSASINALFSSLGTSKPDLTIIYWQPPFPSVPDFVTALLGSSRPVPNFTGYYNPHLDELTAQLTGEVDTERRTALQRQIARLLAEELPWIPVYLETPLAVVSPTVRNWTTSPVSVPLLRDVRMSTSPAP